MKTLKLYLSNQLRHPTGWVGKHIFGRLFTKGNAGINERMLELMALSGQENVLEVGFGPGALLNDIARRLPNGQVEGIDFSEVMLEKAQHLNQSWIDQGRMSLRLGSLEALPYGDDSFDFVCTANTIYFWPEPLANMQELRRVLKPNGRVVIGFRDRDELRKTPLSEVVFRLYDGDEVCELASRAGFAEVDLHRFSGRPLTDYCCVARK